jgi:hypothetical protein
MQGRSIEETGIPSVCAWCRHLTREFQKNTHLDAVFSFMVLEWKSSPPSPSPACRRLSAPTSLDRNLPIFFFLPLFFFFTSPLFPFADGSLPAASACLPAACFRTEVGISGCEKAATLTKEASLEDAPPRTWTELTSAESAAWWGGGDEPPEEYGDVVADEEEARVVVVADEEAERCARRSRRQ